MQIASQAQPDQEANLLNVKDLGAYLGISPSAVYRLVERRDIPVYRLRSGLRFNKADVEAYLNSRRIEAISDNESTYGSTNH